MKTYRFKVVLEQIGGATWGNTREEALKHINEVVQMIVHELQEDGGNSGRCQSFR